MRPHTQRVTVHQAPAGASDWKVADEIDGEAPAPISGRACGRYVIYGEISAGGMGSVYFGRVLGAAGFSRMVAIKRLHRQFARDAGFLSRFKDEARIAARVHHANVVQMLDVFECEGELFLVLEYLHGETLHVIQGDAAQASVRMPIGVIGGILVPALHGLHAAHETADDDGVPLRIVHRDFSPQNILVGPDGNTKVLDFGVARAARQLHVTLHGTLTGKPAFMSPEQIRGGEIDCRSDIFSAGVVLWEALTGKRLFWETESTQHEVLSNVLNRPIPAPSSLRPEVSPELDAVVLRALQREPAERFSNAMEFARQLEASLTLAAPGIMTDWLWQVSGRRFEERSASLANVRRVEPIALGVTGSRVRVPVIEAPDLTSSAALTPAKRRARVLRVVSVACALLVGVCLLLSLLWRRESEPVATARSVANQPSAAASTPSVPLERPAAVRRAELAVPSTTASERRPEPRTRAPASKPPRAARRSPEPGVPAAKSGSMLDCSHPTYLDSMGIRRFKHGCY